MATTGEGEGGGEGEYGSLKIMLSYLKIMLLEAFATKLVMIA